MAKIKLKKVKRTPSPDGHNLRRRELYDTDAGYRTEQQARARKSYRRRVKKDTESCLYTLEFVDALAKEREVTLADGRSATMKVFTLPETAKAMQKIYQTVWRWVAREQVPAPVITVTSSGDKAFHLEEVRVFISVIGTHELAVSYYRRDHDDVKADIFDKIGKVRSKLKL